MPETRRCVGIDGGSLDGSSGDLGGAPDGGGDGPAKKSNGERCDGGAECTTGQCVDGVCCESACQGVCESCNLSGSAGSCTWANLGSDPDGDCAGAHGACGGSCDGFGRCAWAPPTTGCGATTCGAGQVTGKLCDGQGGCADDNKSCGGYACTNAGDGCKQTCSDTAKDCTGTAQCVGSACVDDLPPGAVCGDNDQACASGFCVDGVCCQTNGCGACQRCDIAGKEGTCSAVGDGLACGDVSCSAAIKTTPTCQTGACQAVTAPCAPYQCNGSAANPDCLATCNNIDHCAAGHFCNTSNQCQPKRDNGATCLSGDECKSSVCAQGRCCATACGGAGKPCESCAIAGKEGACSPVAAGTLCGKADLCVNAGASSTIETQRCDGSQSACPTAHKSCAPYTCDSGTNACRTQCGAHDQCTTGLCDLFTIFAQFKKCPKEGEICFADAAVVGPGAGTQSAPHATIQACLDTLKSYVRVADGTYAENLTVKGNVELIAPGTVPPIWQGGVAAKVLVKPVGSAPGVAIDGVGRKAVLYGIGVHHDPSETGTAPLIYSKGADVRLQTVALFDGKGHGLEALDGTSLTLSDFGSGPNASVGVLASGFQRVEIEDALIGFNTSKGLMVYGGQLNLHRSAFWINGTAIETQDATLVDIDRVQVNANFAGLKLLDGSTGEITNALFYGNIGRALEIGTAPTRPKIGNVTIANNNGANEDLHCGSDANIINSIVWDSSGTTFSGSCLFSFSDVRMASGTVGGLGNLNVDPAFVDPTHGNYFPEQTSPCIDAGSDTGAGLMTLPSTDKDGDPRQVDYIPGGAKVDMGAYERQLP